MDAKSYNNCWHLYNRVIQYWEPDRHIPVKSVLMYTGTIGQYEDDHNANVRWPWVLTGSKCTDLFICLQHVCNTQVGMWNRSIANFLFYTYIQTDFINTCNTDKFLVFSECRYWAHACFSTNLFAFLHVVMNFTRYDKKAQISKFRHNSLHFWRISMNPDGRTQGASKEMVA